MRNNNEERGRGRWRGGKNHIVTENEIAPARLNEPPLGPLHYDCDCLLLLSATNVLAGFRTATSPN